MWYPRLAADPFYVLLYVRRPQCEHAQKDDILGIAPLLPVGVAADVLAEF